MNKLTSDVMIELHVPNFELTKIFYNDLGFDVVWEKKPDKRNGYLVMKSNQGDSILNFYCGNKHVYEQEYFKKFPKETVRGYGVEIVIPSDNIKKLYEKIKMKYANQIIEPLTMRFNKLDFRIVDPFGFYIRFVERYNWVNGRDKQGNLLTK